MTSPTTIDLTILHHVTGGNQQAQQQAAQAGLAHSQTCAAWVRSLAANRQLVPPSFPAACGTLRPDIQEGHKIKERGINTGIYESREPGTFW